MSKLRWPGCQQPTCAAICPWSGCLWVCGAGSRDIAVFDKTGSLTQTIASNSFLYPCGLSFDSSTQKAFVLGLLSSYICLSVVF